MTRELPPHPWDCNCRGCNPRSPADPDTSARARLIVAALAIVSILLTIIIIHWRAA